MSNKVFVHGYDYYAFGQTMPGRNYTSSSYRYGYGGHEKDNEVKGDGNSLNLGARIYDPRLGKTLSQDPHAKSYPDLSPYSFVANSPNVLVDKDGNDIFFYDKNGKLVTQLKVPGPDIGVQSTQYTMDKTLGTQVVDIKAKMPSALNKAMEIQYDYFTPSAVGVGGSAAGVGMFGLQGGFESVTFLKGPDALKTRAYGYFGGAFGLDVGISPYVFMAGYFGSDKTPDIGSWKGPFQSYNVNISAIGGIGVFWGNKKGEFQILPNTGESELTWLGISFTPPVSGLAHFGTKFGFAQYQLLPETFQLMNPDLLAEKMFKMKRVDPAKMDNTIQPPIKAESKTTDTCDDECH